MKKYLLLLGILAVLILFPPRVFAASWRLQGETGGMIYSNQKGLLSISEVLDVDFGTKSAMGFDWYIPLSGPGMDTFNLYQSPDVYYYDQTAKNYNLIPSTSKEEDFQGYHVLHVHTVPPSVTGFQFLEVAYSGIPDYKINGDNASFIFPFHFIQNGPIISTSHIDFVPPPSSDNFGYDQECSNSKFVFSTCLNIIDSGKT